MQQATSGTIAATYELMEPQVNVCISLNYGQNKEAIFFKFPCKNLLANNPRNLMIGED